MISVILVSCLALTDVQIQVLCFIGTANAGSTYPGKPYIARFGDSYDNLKEREIPRPDVISKYFDVSDKIDNHNKSRQNDLGLERLWITKNPWFRLSTTFVGIIAVDTWNMIRHHGAGLAYTEMPVKKFAKCLVYDLWNKPWDNTRSRPLQLTSDYECGVCPLVDGPRAMHPTSSTQVGQFSSNNLLWRNIQQEHVISKTARFESGGKGERIRRACLICKNRTMYECQHADCKDKTSKRNRNLTTGVFVCNNEKCIAAHRHDVYSQQMNL